MKMNRGVATVAIVGITAAVLTLGAAGGGTYAYTQASQAVQQAQRAAEGQNYKEAIASLDEADSNPASALFDIEDKREKYTKLQQDLEEFNKAETLYEKEKYEEAKSHYLQISEESPKRDKAIERISEIDTKLRSQSVEKAVAEVAQEAATERVNNTPSRNRSQVEPTNNQTKTSQAGTKQASTSTKEAEEDDTFSVSEIVDQWGRYIAQVNCSYEPTGTGELQKLGGGSGTILRGPNGDRSILSNRHVIYNYNPYRNKKIKADFEETPERCSLDVLRDGYPALTSDDDWITEYGEKDWAYAKFKRSVYNRIAGYIDGILDEFNPSNHFCSQQAKQGDEVVIMGYPTIGSTEEVTVTTGIISSFEESEDLYITDASISGGNSGGAAILKKENCLLGIPSTAAPDYRTSESLGRILDIRRVILMSDF